MTLRRGGVAALAVALLLALSACTATGSAPAQSDSPHLAVGGSRPLEPPTHPHVVRYCPAVDAGHFDGDPEAFDTVYICTLEHVPPSQNGLPRTKQTVDRIAPDAVAALLAAYSAPDAVATDDNCSAVMMDPLVIWVHSGGDMKASIGADIVAMRAPVDSCGFPTDEATAAYQAAPREHILVAREAEHE